MVSHLVAISNGIEAIPNPLDVATTYSRFLEGVLEQELSL
jgi:hypothetical protein